MTAVPCSNVTPIHTPSPGFGGGDQFLGPRAEDGQMKLCTMSIQKFTENKPSKSHADGTVREAATRKPPKQTGIDTSLSHMPHCINQGPARDGPISDSRGGSLALLDRRTDGAHAYI